MDRQRVLVEIDEAARSSIIHAMEGLGFGLDREFAAIPTDVGTIVIRGWVERSEIVEMRRLPGVRSVSEDSEIAPFA